MNSRNVTASIVGIAAIIVLSIAIGYRVDTLWLRFVYAVIMGGVVGMLTYIFIRRGQL